MVLSLGYGRINMHIGYQRSVCLRSYIWWTHLNCTLAPCKVLDAVEAIIEHYSGVTGAFNKILIPLYCHCYKWAANKIYIWYNLKRHCHLNMLYILYYASKAVTAIKCRPGTKKRILKKTYSWCFSQFNFRQKTV